LLKGYKMSNKYVSIGSIILAVLALVIAGVALYEAGQGGDVQTMALTGTGRTDLTTLYLSSDLDVDGTANLDAVDIDGAIDFGDQAITNGGAADFDSTLNVDGAVTLNSTLDVDGAISSGTGVVTVTDDVLIDGTTPLLTIGDAGEEDAGVTFDGNAQDFYVCLDDTADDLVLGFGSACGTTPGISIDESQNTDVAGTLQFGANNNYAVEYASSGEQFVTGTNTVTGTLSVSHGLTTVTWCNAVLGQDPSASAGEPAHVTVAVAANACTVKVWQDDFVTAATASGTVHWEVIGTP
jgi:hypothetical protein